MRLEFNFELALFCQRSVTDWMISFHFFLGIFLRLQISHFTFELYTCFYDVVFHVSSALTLDSCQNWWWKTRWTELGRTRASTIHLTHATTNNPYGPFVVRFVMFVRAGSWLCGRYTDKVFVRRETKRKTKCWKNCGTTSSMLVRQHFATKTVQLLHARNVFSVSLFVQFVVFAFFRCRMKLKAQ